MSPAEWVSETALTRARLYTTIYNLPCTVRQEERIAGTAGAFGALTTPAALGELIHDQLRRTGTDAPIIKHDRDRWTILTGPHRLAADPVIAAQLNWCSAQLAADGAMVWLPSPDDENAGRRRWIARPHDMYRPPIETVLTALDVVTGFHRIRDHLAIRASRPDRDLGQTR
ncbi:DNA-directed RNA polymerase subunit beta [Nocardia terpenica]|uniref:DNA-directed RNA polymerase subunit beta n=1 Tax=Nocardia terpenica TaxID=455432 RepID=UPI002FE3F90E